MFGTRSNNKKLSLHITDRILSALELEDQVSYAQISHVNHVQLDPGVVESGRLQKPNRFRQALENLFSSKDGKYFSQSHATLILPESLHKYH